MHGVWTVGEVRLVAVVVVEWLRGLDERERLQSVMSVESREGGVTFFT